MRIIQSEKPRPLNILAIGPSGLVAAACEAFGVRSDVEVWDAASGSRVLLHEVAEHNAARAIAFTPDGRYLLAGEAESNIAIIDVNSREVAARTQTKLGWPDFALSADGTRALVTSQSREYQAAECFAVEGSAFHRLWLEGPHAFHPLHTPALTFDGTGAAFVSSGYATGSSDHPSRQIEVRNATSGKLAVTIPTDAASPIQQLAFTADGTKLLARTDGRTVQMFDATTGATAGELVHPGRPYVTCIAVHPRGIVACARTNGTVTFWDAEKREQLRTFDWKAGKLVSVAFAPGGALAAAGTEGGKVVVWDVDV